MTTGRLDTHQKAFQLNLDHEKYGTVAEIGAGQEVARWFFRVGGAAGTIAKSISAYDMAVSDAIYGRATRYVSRERLLTMLDREYALVRERLHEERGGDAQFFAFANTVAARSYSRPDDETHGWMGVRFQHAAGAEASEILLHVRLLDAENVQQQEAIGILGVNLIYGAFHLAEDVGPLLTSLLDGLTRQRLEVNLARCTGPAFPDVDARLLALALVERRLTDATMFRCDGEVVDAGELLYKRPLLIARGSFRPITQTSLELVEAARARFLSEPDIEEEDVVVMAEMTLQSLRADDEQRATDFLDRVDLLAALGMHVLVTSTYRNFRLASYLFRHTKRRIATVLGLPTLEEMFRPEFYSDLEGGILEAFGRLFKNDLKLYAYPKLDAATGELVRLESLPVSDDVRHLFAYLIENRFIEGLEPVNVEHLKTYPRDVLARIQSGAGDWEELVPAPVARLIKERGLLGYQG